MKNVFVINGHHPYPFAEGRLNRTLVELARRHLAERNYEVQTTEVSRGWDVEAEIGRHQWADAVLLQFPVNWMGTPWILKKYMDEVYTAGMDGRLCKGDGRDGPGKAHQYGLGGSLSNKYYMLSLTFNAPRDSFENPAAPFFDGRSVDDLVYPVHQTLKFFGLKRLPTFSAHDVLKSPDVDSYFAGYRAHLERLFPER